MLLYERAPYQSGTNPSAIGNRQNMEMKTGSTDWTNCPLVERVSDRMHGVPVVMGTADGVVEN